MYIHSYRLAASLCCLSFGSITSICLPCHILIQLAVLLSILWHIVSFPNPSLSRSCPLCVCVYSEVMFFWGRLQLIELMEGIVLHIKYFIHSQKAGNGDK